MSDSIIQADLKKTITWQFDQSRNLVKFIEMLSTFGKESTEDMWNEIAGKLNLTADDKTSDMALSLIGMIFNIPRFTLSGKSSPISLTFYRKLLLGVWRLYSSAGSTTDYINFSNIVFNGHLKFSQTQSDYQNMVLNTSFSAIESGENADAYAEMKGAYEQFTRYCVPTPAGIGLKVLGDGTISTAYSIGFDTQREEINDSNIKKFVDIQIIGTAGATISSNTVFTAPNGDKYNLSSNIVIGEDGIAIARIFSTKDFDGEDFTGLAFTFTNANATSASPINRVLPEQNIGTFGDNAPLAWIGDFLENK